MKVVADIVTGKSDVKDKAFADGLFIGGERYVMARAEEGAIYARKVGRSYTLKAPKNRGIVRRSADLKSLE